jgi:predicted porin
MKKSLVALAVFGAFAGVASAQSNVTLYGIIDMGLQRNDPKAPGATSTTGVNSGLQSGSRLGFRGTEDLGGGLKAQFALESGFSGDTGALGNGDANVTTRLFGRQAWAGLGGNFGDLVLGRVVPFSGGTGAFDMFGRIDPFATGFGLSSLAQTFSPSGAQRVDNTALYRTPKIGGFQAGLGYSFRVGGAEAAGTGNNNKYLFGAASFEAGPFYGAVTYDVLRPTSTQEAAGITDDQKNLQVGATYDLKVVKLHAAYNKADDEFGGVGVASATGTTNGADASSFMAGVSAPLGPVNLLASYQKRDGKTGRYGATPAANAEADKNVWAIGVTYPFSRRTNAYFNYADSDGKQALNNTTAHDTKQISLGLRHLF